MKVLITGINGFVGSYLAEYLNSKEDTKISGMIISSSDTNNIEQLKDRLDLHVVDIRDFESVEGVIKKIMPDRIFHLAALSAVHNSFGASRDTFAVNVMGQLNLFEAVRSVGINPFIQVAGSSEEYGLVYKEEIPIKETNPLRPLSPYAVSKVTQDLLGFQYFKSYGLNIVRARSFNHTGPRRPENFVCSNFAKQIALIEKKKQEPVIYTGNLDAIRNFNDVRDIVRAYWLCLEKGEPGEVYNICSDENYAIKEVLDILLSLSSAKIEVKQDPERMRKSDAPIIIGDSTKFRKKTGWKPQYPIKKTLEDLLNWWRAKV